MQSSEDNRQLVFDAEYSAEMTMGALIYHPEKFSEKKVVPVSRGRK